MEEGAILCEGIISKRNPMFSVLCCSNSLLVLNPNIEEATNLGHSIRRHLMPNEALLALARTSLM